VIFSTYIISVCKVVRFPDAKFVFVDLMMKFIIHNLFINKCSEQGQEFSHVILTLLSLE